MRKSKFRAWADGEMLDDISTDTDDFTSMLNKTFAYLQESENVKFMQFTGLLDKNGKEVYEGDIIKSCDYPFHDINRNLNYLGEVYFCDVNLGYYIEFHRISKRVRGDVFDRMLTDFDDLEVIGNIYENSELLESR